MESSSAAAARRRRELAEQGAAAHRTALALLRRVGTEPAELDEIGTEPATELRTLDGQLTLLGGLMRERLRGVEVGFSREDVAALSEALHELHTVRYNVHDLLGHEKLRRLDELDQGLNQLRRVADQDDLLETVCESAATAGGFDRVMLSGIDGDIWRPWHSYAREIGEAERSFLAWMRTAEPRIRLSHMLLESEVVRRGEAVRVSDVAHDPRVYRPLRMWRTRRPTWSRRL